jgi:hypothetical protein
MKSWTQMNADFAAPRGHPNADERIVSDLLKKFVFDLL